MTKNGGYTVPHRFRPDADEKCRACGEGRRARAHERSETTDLYRALVALQERYGYLPSFRGTVAAWLGSRGDG